MLYFVFKGTGLLTAVRLYNVMNIDKEEIIRRIRPLVAQEKSLNVEEKVSLIKEAIADAMLERLELTGNGIALVNVEDSEERIRKKLDLIKTAGRDAEYFDILSEMLLDTGEKTDFAVWMNEHMKTATLADNSVVFPASDGYRKTHVTGDIINAAIEWHGLIVGGYESLIHLRMDRLEEFLREYRAILEINQE